MKLSALVVDDSGPAGPVGRELYRTRPDLWVRGTVRCLAEALRFVQTAAPDFVYLPWEAASEMQPEALNFLTMRTRLVFVTAYGSHFMHSMRPEAGIVPETAFGPDGAFPALDFAVPPVTPGGGGIQKRPEPACDQTADSVPIAAVRPVTAQGQTEVVPLDDILWIEAAQNYSKVYRRNAGPDILYHRSMAAWEKVLPGCVFQRLSRSVIIRLGSMRSLTSCGRTSAFVSFNGSPKQLRLGRAAAFRLKAFLRRNS